MVRTAAHSGEGIVPGAAKVTCRPGPYAPASRRGPPSGGYLRTEGQGEARPIRTLYFFHGREAVVISHGVVKQQAAVPPIEIERALKRKSAFEAAPQRHTHKEII